MILGWRRESGKGRQPIQGTSSNRPPMWATGAQSGDLGEIMQNMPVPLPPAKTQHPWLKAAAGGIIPDTSSLPCAWDEKKPCSRQPWVLPKDSIRMGQNAEYQRVRMGHLQHLLQLETPINKSAGVSEILPQEMQPRAQPRRKLPTL